MTKGFNLLHFLIIKAVLMKLLVCSDENELAKAVASYYDQDWNSIGKTLKNLIKAESNPPASGRSNSIRIDTLKEYYKRFCEILKENEYEASPTVSDDHEGFVKYVGTLMSQEKVEVKLPSLPTKVQGIARPGLYSYDWSDEKKSGYFLTNRRQGKGKPPKIDYWQESEEKKKIIAEAFEVIKEKIVPLVIHNWGVWQKPNDRQKQEKPLSPPPKCPEGFVTVDEKLPAITAHSYLRIFEEDLVCFTSKEQAIIDSFEKIKEDEQTRQRFLIEGTPGAGKSVLAKHLGRKVFGSEHSFYFSFKGVGWDEDTIKNSLVATMNEKGVLLIIDDCHLNQRFSAELFAQIRTQDHRAVIIFLSRHVHDAGTYNPNFYKEFDVETKFMITTDTIQRAEVLEKIKRIITTYKRKKSIPKEWSYGSIDTLLKKTHANYMMLHLLMEEHWSRDKEKQAVNKPSKTSLDQVTKNQIYKWAYDEYLAPLRQENRNAYDLLLIYAALFKYELVFFPASTEQEELIKLLSREAFLEGGAKGYMLDHSQFAELLLNAHIHGHTFAPIAGSQETWRELIFNGFKFYICSFDPAGGTPKWSTLFQDVKTNGGGSVLNELLNDEECRKRLFNRLKYLRSDEPELSLLFAQLIARTENKHPDLQVELFNQVDSDKVIESLISSEYGFDSWMWIIRCTRNENRGTETYKGLESIDMADFARLKGQSSVSSLAKGLRFLQANDQTKHLVQVISVRIKNNDLLLTNLCSDVERSSFSGFANGLYSLNKIEFANDIVSEILNVFADIKNKKLIPQLCRSAVRSTFHGFGLGLHELNKISAAQENLVPEIVKIIQDDNDLLTDLCINASKSPFQGFGKSLHELNQVLTAQVKLVPEIVKAIQDDDDLLENFCLKASESPFEGFGKSLHELNQVPVAQGKLVPEIVKSIEDKLLDSFYSNVKKSTFDGFSSNMDSLSEVDVAVSLVKDVVSDAIRDKAFLKKISNEALAEDLGKVTRALSRIYKLNRKLAASIIDCWIKKELVRKLETINDPKKIIHEISGIARMNPPYFKQVFESLKLNEKVLSLLHEGNLDRYTASKLFGIYKYRVYRDYENELKQYVSAKKEYLLSCETKSVEAYAVNLDFYLRNDLILGIELDTTSYQSDFVEVVFGNKSKDKKYTPMLLNTIGNYNVPAMLKLLSKVESQFRGSRLGKNLEERRSIMAWSYIDVARALQTNKCPEPEIEFYLGKARDFSKRSSNPKKTQRSLDRFWDEKDVEE